MPYYVTEDHCRLYYETRGRGRPVVLIHGLTANQRHFRKQIPELARHFEVVTFDLRGHGDSDVPEQGLTIPRLARDLKELLDYLELDRPSLIGWSLGGHVAFDYIRQYSCSSLEKLVVIDMAPRLMKADDWAYGLPGVISRRSGDFGHEDNLLMLAAMLENWEAYSRIVAQRVLNKSLYNEKLEFNHQADFKGKDDLPWLYEEARRNTPHVIVALWVALMRQDYRPLLREINIPTLLTYGEESNYYPPETYAWMKTQIPDAVVAAFPGCGHALHIQDGDRFNRMVIDFLGSRML